MKKKAIILTIILFVVLALGMFVYTKLKTVELKDNSINNQMLDYPQ